MEQFDPNIHTDIIKVSTVVTGDARVLEVKFYIPTSYMSHIDTKSNEYVYLRHYLSIHDIPGISFDGAVGPHWSLFYIINADEINDEKYSLVHVELWPITDVAKIFCEMLI
jgi:hypothetical protein